MKICSNPNCSLAGIPQPFDNFNVRKDRKSGYQSWCKVCARANALRYSRSTHGSAKRREYIQSEQGRDVAKRAALKYEASNKGKEAQRQRYYSEPQKIKARSAVAIAVKQGKLVQVSTLKCVHCDQPAEHYHHHLGYAPKHRLDVIPICTRCHKREHLGNSD